jgi:hypothetical protein
VRYLGYGDEEIKGVDLGHDLAWQTLVGNYPPRLRVWIWPASRSTSTEPWNQIVTPVDSVFGVKKTAASHRDLNFDIGFPGEFWVIKNALSR